MRSTPVTHRDFNLLLSAHEDLSPIVGALSNRDLYGLTDEMSTKRLCFDMTARPGLKVRAGFLYSSGGSEPCEQQRFD